MKKLSILAVASLVYATLGAQTVIDTVSIGSGYANQVWYSLQNDNQGTSPKNNWDLAFATGGMGSTILINSVNNVKLWKYPNADTSGWATVDTSGISSWPALYNSDTSWAYGAFSKGINFSNPYDLGWGIYNPITHHVIGDSLYIIKLSSGVYKKLWIKSLISGTYTFRYANLDGSNDTTVALSKSSFTGKNFGYYSIQNKTSLNREPNSANWDLLFTQYTAFIPSPYTVAGVLSNIGVKVAKASNVDVNTVQWTNYSFNSEINTIGYNWKQYTGSWVIEDSLAYFVKDKTGNIWKVIFTGFGGSANGNYIFSKEKVSAAGVEEITNNKISGLVVYPNPSNSGKVNLIYELTENVNTIQLHIFDVFGREVYRENLNNKISGFYVHNIEVENLESGVYFVTMQADNSISQQKLIIKN